MNLYNKNHLLIGHGQIYSDLPTNSFFGRLSVLVKNYTAQKMNFSLMISSLNVTESAGNNGFCHIYRRNQNFIIFCAELTLNILWSYSN